MIKLETQNVKGPMVTSTLTLQSNSPAPTIVLGASRFGRVPDPTGAKKPDGKRVYVENQAIRVQEIRFVGADENSTLEGQVPDLDAVEIAAAWRVVAEVGFREDFQTGRNTLQVVKVVEVWSEPNKCVWKGKDDPVKASGTSFDAATGKLAKA